MVEHPGTCLCGICNCRDDTDLDPEHRKYPSSDSASTVPFADAVPAPLDNGDSLYVHALNVEAVPVDEQQHQHDCHNNNCNNCINSVECSTPGAIQDPSSGESDAETIPSTTGWQAATLAVAGAGAGAAAVSAIGTLPLWILAMGGGTCFYYYYSGCKKERSRPVRPRPQAGSETTTTTTRVETATSSHQQARLTQASRQDHTPHPTLMVASETQSDRSAYCTIQPENYIVVPNESSSISSTFPVHDASSPIARSRMFALRWLRRAVRVMEHGALYAGQQAFEFNHKNNVIRKAQSAFVSVWHQLMDWQQQQQQQQQPNQPHQPQHQRAAAADITNTTTTATTTTTAAMGLDNLDDQVQATSSSSRLSVAVVWLDWVHDHPWTQHGMNVIRQGSCWMTRQDIDVVVGYGWSWIIAPQVSTAAAAAVAATTTTPQPRNRNHHVLMRQAGTRCTQR